ncbi:SRR1-like protein isoform X2 [Dendroctonus ponderosae]
MNFRSQNDFTKVSYKRRGKAKKQPLAIVKDCSVFNVDSNIRRINEAKTELQSTDFFQSVSALLKEGRISELMVPRYQLALLLCLKALFNVEVLVTDPMFNNNDLSLLKHFEIGWLERNIEGKFKVDTLETYLFYLPHCPKQLMNNLLWCNWGLRLSKCIIIGNSINKVVEDNSKRVLKKSAKYINNISPNVLELGIVNSFTYFDVFNDTSIHCFPIDKLNLLTNEFWDDCEEPEYSDSDMEIIRNSLNKLEF